MNEELEALEKIKNEYDAFYILNQYGDDGTHKKEFEILSTLNGKFVKNALAWIRYEYDCYYKNELGEDSAFTYLEKIIKGGIENE